MAAFLFSTLRNRFFNFIFSDILEVGNKSMCDLCLCVVPFKGKGDAGPPKKKHKRKQKALKEKGPSEKTPAPKQQQKPSPSPAAQKGPTAAKLNGSTAKTAAADNTHTPKGKAML